MNILELLAENEYFCIVRPIEGQIQKHHPDDFFRDAIALNTIPDNWLVPFGIVERYDIFKHKCLIVYTSQDVSLRFNLSKGIYQHYLLIKELKEWLGDNYKTLPYWSYKVYQRFCNYVDDLRFIDEEKFSYTYINNKLVKQDKLKCCCVQ